MGLAETTSQQVKGTPSLTPSEGNGAPTWPQASAFAQRARVSPQSEAESASGDASLAAPAPLTRVRGVRVSTHVGKASGETFAPAVESPAADETTLPLQAVPLQEALFGPEGVVAARREKVPTPFSPSREEEGEQPQTVQPRPGERVSTPPVHEPAPQVSDLAHAAFQALASEQEHQVSQPVRRWPTMRDSLPAAAEPPAAQPGGPALQINLVRRAAAEGGEAEAENTANTEQATSEQRGAAPEAGQAAAPDLDELAEQVYRRLRERLRVERERYGWGHER